MSTIGSESRRAVIMAGGVGSRLLPHSRVLPKPLMLVHGVPLLDLVIRQLVAHDFRRITLCLGYLGKLIRAYCGDGQRFGIRLDYVHEDQPQGTAGALRDLPDFDVPLLIINGDLLTDLDFGQLLAQHQESASTLTLASFQRHHDVPFGVVDFDASGHLTRFREKPRLSHWVSTGIYAASPNLLKFLPPRGPVGFDQVIQRLIDAGQPPRVHAFDGLWLDLARTEEFQRAEEIIELHPDRLLRDSAK